MHPNRRRFLGSLAIVAGSGIAGCTAIDDGEQDSDGDGVPDDEDYAPRDEDVQDESDVRTVTDEAETPTESSDSGSGDADDSGSVGGGDADTGGDSDLQAVAERKMASEGGATSADYRLVVTESEFYQEDYTEGIRGVVENISETNFDYVEIEIGFYDDSDAKLADGLDNTSGLRAGERWRFDAMFLGSNPEDLASFRVTELSGSDY